MNQILLVNDKQHILDRTAVMLDAMGWEIYVARTEDMVFESCVASRPTLIIADVEMQDGAGFESIAAARQLFADLFIIAITRGGHERLWPYVATACGANRYIAGPVSSIELSETIQSGYSEGLIDFLPAPMNSSNMG